MPVRTKKQTASRMVELNLNLKIPRKQYPLVEGVLTAVFNLANLKPSHEKVDKQKATPAPKAARTTKAKSGPKAKSDKAKPGPKKQAKPAAKLKAKPGPKPKAKQAPGRQNAAAPKASKTAALIRDLRTKAGLSQKALAEKLNASQNTVSQLETGKLKASVDMAIKLGQIFGTPFQDLMK